MKSCLYRRRNRRHHTAEAQRAVGILLATLALCTPIPAAAAALPCRQPQLAADGQAVYLACGADETIYISRSSDGGRSFAPLTRVASVSSLSLGMHRGRASSFLTTRWSSLVYKSPSGTICQCCHPSLAIASDGTILAMFRKRRGRPSRFLSDACEERTLRQSGENRHRHVAVRHLSDGWGGIATTADGGIHTVWRRDHTIFSRSPVRRR
jgi:hypothetical protein